MEKLQREMNFLDLRFEDTGFHEIRLCESRCNERGYPSDDLGEMERKCYGKFLGSYWDRELFF